MEFKLYAVVVYSVCVCVCVCVTSGTVSKRLNLGSRKQFHTVAWELNVTVDKDLHKIQVGDFRQITRYK